MKELLKQIPKVDKILSDPLFESYSKKYDSAVLVSFIQKELDVIRQEILKKSHWIKREDFVKRIADQIDRELVPFTRKAVNGTGIVMNTGLGRAPFSENAVIAAEEVMRGYCTLEVDVKTGKRGRREDGISNLISLITGAEAATVVNNNAAAVFICINTLSNRKEAVISRGELVEIGGSFRMPDIIKKSGAKMKEVGATNKTKLSDYKDALSSRTGALLKVHSSNYRIEGFTQEVSLKELAGFARRNGVLLYYDLGGGIFGELSKYGLPHEPTVSEAVRDGADVFSFSGDKVLGGPQCGIIAGRKDIIEKIKKNPLMRVLRLDKVRLALLEETLKYFITKDPFDSGHATLKLLSEKRPSLKKKTQELVRLIKATVPQSWKVCAEDVFDQAGSGAMPTEKLKGAAVSIVPEGLSVTALSEMMRTVSNVPIFGYINNERYYLSLRTIFENDFPIICGNLEKICLRIRS